MRVVIPGSPPRTFTQPSQVLRADTADQVHEALAIAERALADGKYCAGYLSYELGAVFASLPVRQQRKLPLLALGIYAAPDQHLPIVIEDDFALGTLRPRIERHAYDAALRAIANAIYDGDVYQVNYTVPFDFAFSGDPYALFCALLRTSGVSNAAYVEDTNMALVSLSPELFLSLEGAAVRTMPMKGTSPPGHAHDLTTPKNRAEHLMIVDLLRNDLHRVCNSVEVPALYTLEKYPTFETMTSTIAGTLRPDFTLSKLLAAVFPCGSITGAPKRAAMQVIESLEPHARDAYTGSIGYMGPDGTGRWNVAIRTLQLDTSVARGRLDIGGGIVADSQPQNEWDEILIKSRFVARYARPFELIETFLCGTPQLHLHLQRLGISAKHFDIPFDARAVGLQVERLGQLDATLVRLSLQWDGQVGLETRPYQSTLLPVRICLSAKPVSSSDPLLAFKTSWRSAYDRAFAYAQERGCFDVVFCNERAELTEGSRTSLFVESNGKLFTPPLHCGVLPGILRQTLLEQGRAREKVLYEEDLLESDGVYVGNAARGLLRAEFVKELSGV
ncbi:MAG: chorismate-binding protein [Candidatus Eremiobacteraeota bacterium]|nr:chorismate-binding protein [Candidatus Eremiobacteraeota bacterium]